MKKLTILGAALAFLSGCVSGTNYSVNTLDSLKPGMSKAEVIALLGKPNTEARLPDGQVMLGWARVKASVLGASARSVSLQFDTEGKLLDTGYRFQSKPN